MPLGERKEAEMKPTPRSERMGIIADALMAARNFADKAQVPESVPLIGGQGLGSLVLGKAPEELNEMSYGNMPMRINPLAGRTASYVPEMKAGRKEQVADLAMLAGVPKVGKAGVGFAGVGDVGGGAEKALMAYHGTPHRFAPEPDAPLGAFKAEKIGSGEGAQVYGHGLYFAESPNVAKKYQKVLSLNRGEFDLIDKKTETLIPEDTPGFSLVKDRLKSYGADLRDSDIVRFKELWQDTRKRYNEKLGEIKELNKKYAGDTKTLAIIADTKKDYINKIKELEDASTLIDKVKRQPAGSLYTVDIPDEKIEKMLDWDVAIGEQPEEVQKIFNKLAKKDREKFGEGGGLDYYMSDPDSFSGETIYKYLVEQFGGQKEVSDFLQKEGIPGVKYFDEFSRSAGEGTRNIVVFPGEEKNIKILKRNEEAPKFAKGGMMKPTIKGFQDGGMNVDPVSGNEVPTGSLPEEVRDDVDAKLSPGEFVIPADVVRFIGLERLMKMRDEAKKGIQRMSEIGQMGNADEVGEESNSTYEDDGFESEIDDILGEVETEQQMAEGGLVGEKTGQVTRAGRPVYKTKEGANVSELSITVPYKGVWANVPSIHNGKQYSEDEIQDMLNKGKIKPTSVHKSVKEAVDAAKKRSDSLLSEQTKMAFGGYVGSGTDLTKAPKNPVFDVRYYKNKEGATMFITHINGKPMTPVPEGFTAVSAEEAMKVGQAADEEAAAKKKLPTQDDYGYSDTPQTFERVLTPEEEAKREEQLTKANAFLTKAVPFVVPGMALAQKAAAFLKGKEQPPAPVEQRTGVSAAAIQAQDLAFSMGLSTENAAKAAKAAEEAAKSGVDTNKAASDAVFAVAMEQQSRGIAEELEALNASTSTTSSTSSSSRGMTSAGSSFAVSPPSVAATAPVRGSNIESRNLDTSVDNTPEGEDNSFTTGDWGGLAKGGLVSKRQYPAKKKKGKGIAASK